MALFGQSGAGKSHLARVLLEPLGRVIVIDTKHEFELSNAVIVDRYDPRHNRQIFRPRSEDERAECAAYLTAVWNGGNPLPGVIYADECNDLAKSSRAFIPIWNKIIRQGRSKKLCAWNASQRPSELPGVVFTEAKHFFLFYQGWANDRKKIESFTMSGIADQIESLPEYSCIYMQPKNRVYRILPPTVASFANPVHNGLAVQHGGGGWPRWLRR